MSKLTTLIQVAEEKSWCTQLYCTTCGALDFRGKLRKLSKEEILEDLRALSPDFCERHSDVLRLVFVEIAIFPTCFDLISPLENTPAGEVLQSAIRHSNYISERRKEHDQWCSPEAAKERAVARKRENEIKHRLRISKKLEFDKSLEVFRHAILQANFDGFFTALAEVKDASIARAVGGLAYAALHQRLRDGDLSSEETRLLERCASNFGGHWNKLMRARPSEEFTRPI
jgi:hypothetical protein